MSVNHRLLLSHKPTHGSGFTLIELMVTVSIAAILLAIAVPSFISTIRSTRLTNSANDLVTALNLARSEAIKRGRPVTVASISASSQWENGWNVFIDLDANDEYDSDTDTLLRTYDALPSGYTLTAGTAFQTYSSTGLSSVDTGDTFTICGELGESVPIRTITISPTGRPNVAVGTGACPAP